MEFSVLGNSTTTATKRSKIRFQDGLVENDEKSYNTRKKRNSGVSNAYMIATPPTTPHRQRYYKKLSNQLEKLCKKSYNEINSSSSISNNSTKPDITSLSTLVRQHTMPILEPAQISSDVGILRRVQSATEGATSISEATVEKLKRQQEYDKLQQKQKEQRKTELNQDDALQKYPWNHDAWLNLSRYYEAVGRNVDRTVNVFYRHESIGVIKDNKDGKHDIMERWSQDVIRWKVLCLVYVTIKHGGVTLLQRVQAYNEKKRRRSYHDQQKQHLQQKKQVHDDDRHNEVDEEEDRHKSKRFCHRLTSRQS